MISMSCSVCCNKRVTSPGRRRAAFNVGIIIDVIASAEEHLLEPKNCPMGSNHPKQAPTYTIEAIWRGGIEVFYLESQSLPLMALPTLNTETAGRIFASREYIGQDRQGTSARHAQKQFVILCVRYILAVQADLSQDARTYHHSGVDQAVSEAQPLENFVVGAGSPITKQRNFSMVDKIDKRRDCAAIRICVKERGLAF